MFKLYLLIFISGFTHIMYQTIWTKALIPILGLTYISKTFVLILFFTGILIGNLNYKKFEIKSQNINFKKYSFLEFAIVILNMFSLLAFIFLKNLNTNLYIEFENSWTYINYFISTIILLPPFLFIGLCFPALVQLFENITSSQESNIKSVNQIYLYSTLGACGGILFSGFYLLQSMGIYSALIITIIINTLLALFYYFQNNTFSYQSKQTPLNSIINIPKKYLILSFLSGFYAIGIELISYRILSLYFQGTYQTYILLLFSFIFGIAVASFFIKTLFNKVKFKNEDYFFNSIKIIFLLSIIFNWIILSHFNAIIMGLTQFTLKLVNINEPNQLIFQQALVLSLIITLQIFLSSLTFPLLSKFVNKESNLGSGFNKIIAFNNIGIITGILLLGVIFFKFATIQITLIFISLSLLAYIFIYTQHKIKWVIPLVFCSLLILPPKNIIMKMVKNHESEIVFFKEGLADFVYVSNNSYNINTLHYNDRRGTCSDFVIVNKINRMLAYTSIAQNPKAKKVLVISMGCGNTASAFTKFPIEKLDIVDVSENSFKAADHFKTNDNVLKDKRVQFFVDDGRNFLKKNIEQYDIIQIELPTIHTDGVAYLYTEEFYKLVNKRLKDKGVLSQWIHSTQLGRDLSLYLVSTLKKQFPNYMIWGSEWAWWYNGVKTNEKFKPLDINQFQETFKEQKILDDMQTVGMKPNDLLSYIVNSSDVPIDLPNETLTDNFLKIEGLIASQKTVEGYGGGVGFYMSYFRSIYVKEWNRQGINITPINWVHLYSKDIKEKMNLSIKSSIIGIDDSILNEYINKQNKIFNMKN